MKKILLGTTALIGAATLYAGAACAGEDPKVTVGGYNNFEAGYTHSDFNNNEQNRAFRNETEIHFNVAGKADNGLGYGAEIDLIADIDGGDNSSSPGFTQSGIVAHRTYTWLQGDNWGHFEMGSNDGAARTLKVDASSISRATGGIDGDWKYFADVNSTTSGLPSGTGSGAAGAFGDPVGHFITAPDLPVEHGPTTGFSNDLWGNDNKVTYYTPRFSGFQLGVSYAPELANRGELTNRVETGSTAYSDIWEGGINYEGQFDQIGFAAAATGEMGKAPKVLSGTDKQDIRAWNGGAKVAYMGFSLAGSYGDWRDSTATEGTNTKADYWTVGGAYETGPFGASVAYMESKIKPTGFENKFKDVSAGIDYKLAPGLTPFVEYTWYKLDPSGAGTSGFSNKGDVVLVGTQLSF